MVSTTSTRIKSLLALSALLLILSAGTLRAYADSPATPPPTATPSPDVETAAALELLTTTGSDAPLVTPPPPLETTDTLPIIPLTNVSGPLINLDDFRSDYRFAQIDGSGLSVVILDTGIDLDHPYFGPDANGNGVADRIVYHYDFADGDANASDVNGHGSNVSSIVAASFGPYTGMATGANIIHLKVFKDSGSGQFSYIESALQWVVAHAHSYNIASVNMSLGDGGNYFLPITAYGISDELAALAELNVIVVSASGNSFYGWGSTQGVSYPAADPNSLSIGAVYDSNAGSFGYGDGSAAYTTGADRITPFSQRHATLTTIFAPGAPISGAGATGGTVTQHGTSQASPHIAGIAALMQELAQQVLGRKLTPAEFKTLLKSSGATINDGDDENDNVTNTNLSFKRVDVLALGQAVLALDTTPPQVSHLTSNADTGDGALAEEETTEAAITQLIVTFDEQVQNPAGDTGGHDVSNPANYRLFTPGPDATFQTDSCGSAQGDDQTITINNVVYNGDTHLATLNLNGGTRLDPGRYRLLVCGSTSIKDLAGNSLDGDGNGSGGDDFSRTYTVSGSANLSIIKTVSLARNPVQPGDVLTYTIVLANSGPANATGVHLVDSLPAGISGTGLNVTTVVTAGAKLTYTLVATAAPQVALGATLTNTAVYSYAFGGDQASAAFNTVASTTAVIDLDPEAESTLITPDHLFTLTIPAEALPANAGKLRYTRLAQPTVPNPANFAGLVFDLKLVTALGQVLSQPTFDYALTLDINYDPAQLPPGTDESKMGLVFYNSATGQWQQITVTGRNPAARTLSVNLAHFTEFALTTTDTMSLYLPLVTKPD